MERMRIPLKRKTDHVILRHQNVRGGPGLSHGDLFEMQTGVYGVRRCIHFRAALASRRVFTTRSSTSITPAARRRSRSAADRSKGTRTGEAGSIGRVKRNS